MNLIKRLEEQPKSYIILLCTCLIFVVSLIDYYVPPEIYVAIFYLITVGITTWFISKFTGFITSLLNAITLFLINNKPENHYIHPFVPYCNTIILLAFLIFINYFLSEIKLIIKNLETLARTDDLTGLTNRMFFLEILNYEINKSLRYQEPLTVAYIDIDDFKQVNDKFGHIVGDRVLCSVANTTKGTLRKIDVIARIGGDEFAILLPRTGYESAAVVLQRVQRVVLASMREQGLTVTFSIGAITFHNPPNSVNEIINQADRLMYSVKRKGKNSLKHELAESSEAAI